MGSKFSNSPIKKIYQKRERGPAEGHYAPMNAGSPLRNRRIIGEFNWRILQFLKAKPETNVIRARAPEKKPFPQNEAALINILSVFRNVLAAPA